jgi:hypothetical protein
LRTRKEKKIDTIERRGDTILSFVQNPGKKNKSPKKNTIIIVTFPRSHSNYMLVTIFLQVTHTQGYIIPTQDKINVVTGGFNILSLHPIQPKHELFEIT